MVTSSRELQTLDQLREYVTQTLCIHDELELDAFPVSERILLRGGVPCGMFFCLHGPRSVRYTAVWETDGNSILFYGSTGERFQKTTLVTAPCLESAPELSDAAG